MNWEECAGQWKQHKGRLRSTWGKLTDDDLNSVGGKKDVLIGKIQQRYGMAKEEAERQIDQFLAKLTPQQPPQDRPRGA